MTKKAKYFPICIAIILVAVFVACMVVIYAKNIAIERSETSYDALSLQRDVIKEDFNKVYSYDNYTITPIEEGHKVTLSGSSHDIAMICNFDSDFKYVDSTYIEPTIIDHYLLVIGIIIGFGTCVSFAIIVLHKNLFYC